MRFGQQIKEPRHWGWFVAGMVFGPWALNKVAQVTGVGISVPSVPYGSQNG